MYPGMSCNMSLYIQGSLKIQLDTCENLSDWLILPDLLRALRISHACKSCLKWCLLSALKAHFFTQVSLLRIIDIFFLITKLYILTVNTVNYLDHIWDHKLTYKTIRIHNIWVHIHDVYKIWHVEYNNRNMKYKLITFLSHIRGSRNCLHCGTHSKRNIKNISGTSTRSWITRKNPCKTQR